MAATKRKPDAGGVRLPNALSCCSAEKHSENTPEDLALQAKIPSRATLARRFALAPAWAHVVAAIAFGDARS